MIWGNREQEYFCGRDWTGQITLKPLQKIDFARTSAICPTGRIKELCGRVMREAKLQVSLWGLKINAEGVVAIRAALLIFFAVLLASRF